MLVYCGVEVVHPKSDEQRRRLNDAIKHILLFRSLEEVIITVCLSVCLSVSMSVSTSLCVSEEFGLCREDGESGSE